MASDGEQRAKVPARRAPSGPGAALIHAPPRAFATAGFCALRARAALHLPGFKYLGEAARAAVHLPSPKYLLMNKHQPHLSGT